METKTGKIKWFVIENDWLQRGHSQFGWGNGYAAIPKGHKCYGMDYNEIHNSFDDVINVNGGLTFSSSEKTIERWSVPDDCKGHWIVGFDTCHYGDTLSRWPKEAVEREAQKLAEQLESIE